MQMPMSPREAAIELIQGWFEYVETSSTDEQIREIIGDGELCSKAHARCVMSEAHKILRQLKQP